METKETDTLKNWVREANRIVFFGGAGVSTESGLKDFRSVDGLYRERYEFPPEEILSRSFFETHERAFWQFYGEKLSLGTARPNAAHRKLAQWEREAKLSAVVTQNIDGLHQAAGSENVFELHGSVHRNHCLDCGKFFGYEDVMARLPLPRCECGGRIKPDVVLYGEDLDYYLMRRAANEIAAADLLIAGGTSLSVYPAAGLIDYYRGTRLVLINKTPTPFDSDADLVITEPIGFVLGQL